MALKFASTSISGSTTGQIAIGASDSTIRIHTISGSSITESKKIITRSIVTTVSYSPDGSLLAAGDSSGKITLFEVSGGEYKVKTTRWAFHTARVESIVWNSEGTHVVTGSLDTNVFIYSVANPVKNLKAGNAHMGGVNAVGWEGGDVVSVGADGCVKRWAVTLAG